jgi:hypothetical protein
VQEAAAEELNQYKSNLAVKRHLFLYFHGEDIIAIELIFGGNKCKQKNFQKI